MYPTKSVGKPGKLADSVARMSSITFTTTASDPEYSGSAALVAQAVAAAHAAQRAWAARSLEERAEALRTMAAEISERLVEIAGVVSAETGKNRIEALPEVQEGA